MAAQLLGDLFLNGIAAAPSGTARFYQVGTLTPVTVYSNDAATTAVTQPVNLDASGKSTVPIYLTVPCRMIVQTNAGATVLDVERVDGVRAEATALANTSWPTSTSANAALTNLATSLGGTDGNFKASGTGSVNRAVQTKLSETVSVKDLGAKGDGITDDTAAFVAALTYASSIGGATIYVPAGTYLISTTLVVSVNGASFKGTGSLTSIIQNTNTSTDCLSVSANRLYIEDIGMSHSSTSTAAAINLTTTTGFVTVSRVRMTGHRTGVAVSGTGSTRNIIKDCEIICDGNAAAFGINNSATATGLVASQCYIDCGAAGVGNGVSLFTSSINAVLMGNYIKQAAIGFVLSTAAGTALIGNAATTTGGSVANFYSITLGNVGSSLIGNNDYQMSSVDTTSGQSTQTLSLGTGRWSAGYNASSTTAVITGSVTINNRGNNHFHIQAGAAGITITVANPSTTPPTPGATISFFFENASGGAVTWTFGSAYRVAAVAPANGTGIGMVVAYNATLAKWTEISRGTAA